jgi:hypothetical protein
MNEIDKKLKIIEISNKLKKDIITYGVACKELNNIINPKVENCWHCGKFENKQDIQETNCKYPNGLPLDTLDIKYCNTCGTIIDVEW